METTGQTDNSLALRNRTEAALRESEARFRALLEHTTDAVYVQTETRFAYLNPAALRFFGATDADQLLGQPILDRFHPDSRERVRQRMRLVNEEKRNVPTMEHTYLRLDGSQVAGEVTSAPIVYDGNNGAVVIVRDTTERRREEEALRASEARYRLISENCADVIWLFDLASNRFAYVSPSVRRLLGYTPEEVLAQTPEQAMTPASYEAVMKLLPGRIAALKSGEESVRVQTNRVEQIRNDGSTVPTEVVTTLLSDARGRATQILGVSRDVSDRVRLEEELLQARKMESIGRLAGGVAHDFNNILAVILGYGEMVESDLPAHSPMRAQVREIMTAGERAKDLTRQLLAFSRKQVIELKTLDINDVVRGMVKMLQRLLGEDIEARVVLNPGMGRMKADPSQLEQVLMNLCVNARDAMSDGGILTIETDAVVLDGRYAQTHPGIAPGPYVVLTVSDTGSGMDEDVRAHIFEPFYTTKEVGKGSGMGLATVFGIIKQHGGDIQVSSEPGRGSSFRIYLPEIAGEAADAREDAAEWAIRGNGEAILVLEDEEPVRKLACQVLSRLGYTAIEARNGEECLELARGAQRIDLLLADVIMPGMNGRQAYERAAAIRKGIKVLFMSGYSEDAVGRHGILEDGLQFITKPFTEAALSRKIRQALDK